MIGYLKGNIVSSKPTEIILDVNGVGYLINISINTFEKISGQKEVSLYIFTNVKEDSITLYGFHSESEKEIFELLITVNGIGPKSALSLLSGINSSELKNAIERSDVSRITAIPGIGKKTAERLVLELKSKVEKIALNEEQTVSFGLKKEAIAALNTLGYNLKAAENAIREVLSDSPDCSIEELIKKALNRLNN